MHTKKRISFTANGKRISFVVTAVSKRKSPVYSKKSGASKGKNDKTRMDAGKAAKPSE